MQLIIDYNTDHIIYCLALTIIKGIHVFDKFILLIDIL